MQPPASYFKSESKQASGWGSNRGWSAEIHTCLEPLDKSGNTIYAEGTVTFSQQEPNGRRSVAGSQTIDNRATSGDGKYFIRGKQIYKQADSQAALQDILSKLVLIGRQNV